MVVTTQTTRMIRHWILTVPVFALFLTSCLGEDGTYMVLIPKVIRPCVDFALTAQNLGSNGYMLNVTLEDGKGEVLATSVAKISNTRYVVLKTPCDLVRGSYYVKVVGYDGVVFEKKQFVSFNPTNVEVIIQTDKKVYKPSQTVKYRIFAVKTDLTPKFGEFEVTITDPKRNKIRYFIEKGDSFGVLQKEIQLTSEPIFGVWTIKATIGSTTHTSSFSIEKYVLPKAEAIVQLPSFLAESQEYLNIKVEGKYTFGKSMRGSGTLKVMVEKYPLRRYEKNPETGRYELKVTPPPYNTYEFELTEKGVYMKSIRLEELKELARYGRLSYKTIYVSANITDSETGIVYSSRESSVAVKKTVEKLSFALNPRNYKPGLINTFYIELKQQDGRPVVNPRTLKVSARVKYEVKTTTTSTTTTTTTTAKPPSGKVILPVKEEIFVRDIFYPHPVCNYPTYEWKDLTDKILNVPSNGLVRYDLFVGDFEALNVEIKATYDNNTFTTVTQNLAATKSPSNTFLSVSLLTEKPAVNSYARFKITATAKFNKMYYTVLSRGVVAYTSHKTFRTASTVQNLAFRIYHKMAPRLRIVVYIIGAKGEIVADAISFNVDGVFKNKVSLAFDKETTETGTDATLSVKAYRYSRVYAVAVDKSTTLLGAKTDDHAGDVQDFLNQLDSGYIPYYGPVLFRGGIAFRKKREAALRKKREAELLSRHRRLSIYWPYPFFTSGVDAEDMFRNTGVYVITDALLYNYRAPRISCNYYRKTAMAGAPMPAPPMAVENSIMTDAAPVEVLDVDAPVRSFFPETWIWDSQSAGAAGMANFSLRVPDTITSWVASAFAISRYPSQGVGMTSDIAKLTVIRQFFVNLNLPYSVIQGEEVRIQAVIFNYLGQDIKAQVALEDVTDFIVLELDVNRFQYETQKPKIQVVKVHEDGTASVFFTIRCNRVGTINIQIAAKAGDGLAGDKISRQLLVEPEGIPEEYSEVALVDLSETKLIEKSLAIRFPPNVVPDSQRIIITAYGDPLGSALNNIDRLIRMPGGCGEQNMLSLTPNVYVWRYLAATGQLTAALKAKLTTYLTRGYANQLRYMRSDSSFSAFGNSDKSGSQWLTAYVLRVLSEASEYIYIDENILSRAARYLISNQQKDGSFIEPGRVLHKELRGSSFQGDALLAFTLLSLFEVKDKTSIQTNIDLGVARLIKVSVTMTNAYDLAITGYTLLRAGKIAEANVVLSKLEAIQVSSGAQVHWDVVIDSERVKYFWNPPHRQSSAVNIEATAYALLAYAYQKNVLKGLPVMSWLISQQNAHGGYSSSQDTVVALQGLSLFASQIYGDDWNLKLTINACRQHKIWDITKATATVLRKWVTNETTDSIDIKATGTGRAIVMVTVRYNVKEVDVKSSFGLRVAVVSETVSEITLKACAVWRVAGRSSGMALVMVGLPSGFSVDDSNLINNELIKRTESASRKFILYLDQISSKEICFEIRLVKKALIGKLKGSYITLVDYYNTENTITVPYALRLSQNADVCEVCAENCKGCIIARKR